MRSRCTYLWPSIFFVSNGLCALQLIIETNDLHPFLRQYTHMTMIVTALYATIAIRQYDVTALCALCFAFSVQWHSGLQDWKLPDGWLSRSAILYICARPVVEHGLAAIVVAGVMVGATWVWQTELAFCILLGVIGMLLIIQYKKLFWPDVLATAVFAVSGYMCYRTEELGLHGLWHSFMATAAAFAATAQKTSKWHLLVPWDKPDLKPSVSTLNPSDNKLAYIQF